jgi:hypothetical protein
VTAARGPEAGALPALDLRRQVRDHLRMDMRRNDLRGNRRSDGDRVPTNLSLPRALVAEVDALAGRRGRSAFVESALRRAVKRERLRAAWERAAGALSAEEYPYWRSPEDVVSWVRERRAEETREGITAEPEAGPDG